MTKAKWREQADAYLQQIMELLKLYEEGTHIGQGSYKSDFFRIFADAFRSGYCTLGYRFDVGKGRLVPCKLQRPLISGDAIWSFAKHRRWVNSEMTGVEKRYCDIEIVRTWWDEWVYAWKHPIPRRKYVRRRHRGGHTPLEN